MKIETSQVLMNAKHKSKLSAQVSESLTITGGRGRMEAARQTSLDAVRISASRLHQHASASAADKTENSPYELSDEDKLKIKLIEQFVKNLTGKDIKIVVPDKLVRDDDSSPATDSASAPQGSGNSGIGIIYSKTVSATQSEAMAFSATATITTADGRTMNADISLSLAKSFTASETTTLRFGSAVDPLVVNFGAASASATMAKYTFDLNVDGKTEQISFVGPGSGLLALDKNGDGRVGDGSELFGPQSGNGFLDLSAYDKDGNQWIDENDGIFDMLQIWDKAEDGTDRLFAITAKGIGAIYLGNVETPFSLENAGRLDANIRRTGIFLRENGTAGTLQHVDMVV